MADRWDTLRTDIETHQSFLKQLLTGNKEQNQATIEGATKVRLILLYNLIHEIATGNLPIKKEQFSKLKNSKGVLRFIHRHFLSPGKVKFFVDHDVKSPVLKLSAFYKHLLHSIFYE